ncbi:MAG: indolepyruvate oxidoreductase subunit beta [Phycisphaerales bacterium]|nr:MAG: indolepyruvate oxidoreductase subunit beta [Phycisphaerales bacterium]
MEYNIILAGVGGQGILTIAQALSLAAMRRGRKVKQSEVHGMSQRGGAVQSHLRFSDGDLYSDLVPRGKADMILSVEPLEVLRYVQYLSPDGVIVSNSVPFVNIPNYSPIEDVLDQVTAYPRHVLLDADKLAKAAGSPRAMNMIMLGAASYFMGLEPDEFDEPIAQMFGRKGQALVEMNQGACRTGRKAAAAYREALERGQSPQAVRQWMQSADAEELIAGPAPGHGPLATTPQHPELSAAEETAVSQLLEKVYHEGRRQLYENEVYSILELVGGITPPRHLLVTKGEQITPEALSRFPGNQVVLKIVSPDVVHKTEAGGVVFVQKDIDTVNREIAQLIARQETAGRVTGALVCEFVEPGRTGLGSELFVGIRATREFGPIIAAGLGGLDTEYLASKMKPGISVAKALVEETTADDFFDLFEKTAAYEILSGQVRGHRRLVSDGELRRCFRAFIAIGRRYCVDRGEEGPDVGEMEVNPFAFSRQRMIPLDGRGRLQTAYRKPAPRPFEKINALLEPRSIAILGVSTKRANFGRIILDNLIACGYPRARLFVVKEGENQIDGVPCVSTIGSLPSTVDLLVVATAARNMPALVDQIIESGKVASVIVIPGGMGETEDSRHVEAEVRRKIAASRLCPDRGPIFLGGNCMGVRSRPGGYDTFFIPRAKLDPRYDAPARRVALVSQSGAFIITRLSNLGTLDPAFAISIGNQIDLTLSDMLQAVGARDDVDVVGVYAEGFNDLDGSDFVRVVREVTTGGKVVVFYKAGRTETGRSATAGHTASIAGDYDICDAAVGQAGAIVVDTFKEFEQLVALATALHGKQVSGLGIGVISNAGYETVGMADAIFGARYRLEIPALSEATVRRITDLLKEYRLDTLVNVHNPLDLTPMANEDIFEGCVRAMADDDGISAVVASAVPLTPQMLTAPQELASKGSLPDRWRALFAESTKPMIAVIDSGSPFEELARRIHAAGVPVFQSCDQAVRSLGRYLCHRAERQLPVVSRGATQREKAPQAEAAAT